ncbi:similar to exonuclease NEF-sp (predicted), isoform CRA_g [Rattus norvegicus]|uniref:Similar to exonuclease NEF-sp (Predicted), isoform CRA_g n=1 Tax=Rattus norvegicus TaxID=10116 RepID=A6I8N9_RAT|nr:similar to exonuclease NEF-sp (predicted), isoform CRA_g [Rattus norvegicus]
MKTFHFPLQGSPNCENFILLKYSGFITDSSPLFGLDCEVCLTSMGKELTRISLVAEGGYCLMDELVKPDFKILDYLTRYSLPHLTVYSYSYHSRIEYDLTGIAYNVCYLSFISYFQINSCCNCTVST